MSRASALRRQKNRTALLGAFVLIIIIIVITSVFTNIFHKSKPITPKINAVEATTYENYIAPLVILDILPFESISKAPQDELLLASIWSILLPIDASKYQFADDLRMILPQADVDKAYMNLFGVLPKHKSIDSRGMIFDYSIDDKCYYIPAQGIENSFSPHIIASKQSGKNIVLTVEYIPSENWQQDTSGKIIPAKANKKMIYTLEKNASKLKIISVRKG